MAQVIKRNRRRDYRRDGPNLSVQLAAGDVFVTRDWSLGGLRIDGLATTRQPGEPVVGALRHGAADGPWHRFVGSVVRIDGHDAVSIKFEDLSPGGFELLQSLLCRPPPDDV